MQIHKKFAFDASVPSIDYERYIDPDDLLNESFEKLKDDFEAYRRKRGKDIVKEEQLQRKQIQDQRKKGSSLQTGFDEIMQESNQKQLIGVIDRFLKHQEQKCKELHRRVQSPEFGQQITGEKQQIQKSEIQKQPIFTEADFVRLIEKEEEEEEEMHGQYKQKETIRQRKGFVDQKGKYKSWPKLGDQKRENSKQLQMSSDKQSQPAKDEQQLRRTKTKTHSVKLLSKESFKKEVIRNAKDTFEHYDVLRKTWEKFGVQHPKNLDFRVESLKQAKLQRLLLKTPEFEQQQKNNYTEQLKSNNLNAFLLNVMTKPIMNEQLHAQKNLVIHQTRIRSMKERARQLQTATR